MSIPYNENNEILEHIAKNIDNLATKDFINETLKKLTLEFCRREDELYIKFKTALKECDDKYESSLKERDIK